MAILLFCMGEALDAGVRFVYQLITIISRRHSCCGQNVSICSTISFWDNNLIAGSIFVKSQDHRSRLGGITLCRDVCESRERGWGVIWCRGCVIDSISFDINHHLLPSSWSCSAPSSFYFLTSELPLCKWQLPGTPKHWHFAPGDTLYYTTY